MFYKFYQKKMKFRDILKNKNGKIIISCILGLGLASLFKKVCVDDNCLIIKSPPKSEIDNHIFGSGDKCYVYNPEVSECKK